MANQSRIIDGPKTLASVAEREARAVRLRARHIEPLTSLAEAIRLETGRGDQVPDFDPDNGGVEARCLFLLEAPGAQAVRTRFVSRNNPDETAKNLFELSREAGIPRHQTVIWNIVPWYIGSGTKIRAARRADIKVARPYLKRLLAPTLLPKLEIVVLVGKKAQVAKDEIAQDAPSIKLLTMSHPSPLFVNRKPENRALLLNVLLEVARVLLFEEKVRT